MKDKGSGREGSKGCLSQSEQIVLLGTYKEGINRFTQGLTMREPSARRSCREVVSFVSSGPSQGTCEPACEDAAGCCSGAASPLADGPSSAAKPHTTVLERDGKATLGTRIKSEVSSSLQLADEGRVLTYSTPPIDAYRQLCKYKRLLG